MDFYMGNYEANVRENLKKGLWPVRLTPDDLAQYKKALPVAREVCRDWRPDNKTKLEDALNYAIMQQAVPRNSQGLGVLAAKAVAVYEMEGKEEGEEKFSSRNDEGYSSLFIGS
ncbi:hypothetical protein KKA53_05005 [Candidatus Dependentiae bacterium]|nr:hypothetical protein [Candidatus Dependentiae bacterium]